MSNVKFVAHRGESAIAPENTLESYILAWRNGASWGVETDVYLSADNVLVCMHDPNTLRTTGVDSVIREHTLAALKRLDAGIWKGAQWLNCHVPTLREVFSVMPPDGHIFVEIKSAGDGFPKAFNEALNGGGINKEQVSFISFERAELEIAGKELPGHKRYLLRWISNTPAGADPSAKQLIEELKSLGVEGVDAGGEEACITEEYVAEVKKAGFEFHCWTIDNLDYAVKLAGFGVDSITTNCPSQLKSLWPE